MQNYFSAAVVVVVEPEAVVVVVVVVVEAEVVVVEVAFSFAFSREVMADWLRNLVTNIPHSTRTKKAMAMILVHLASF